MQRNPKPYVRMLLGQPAGMWGRAVHTLHDDCVIWTLCCGTHTCKLRPRM